MIGLVAIIIIRVATYVVLISKDGRQESGEAAPVSAIVAYPATVYTLVV